MSVRQRRAAGGRRRRVAPVVTTVQERTAAGRRGRPQAQASRLLAGSMHPPSRSPCFGCRSCESSFTPRRHHRHRRLPQARRVARRRPRRRAEPHAGRRSGRHRTRRDEADRTRHLGRRRPRPVEPDALSAPRTYGHELVEMVLGVAGRTGPQGPAGRAGAADRCVLRRLGATAIEVLSANLERAGARLMRLVAERAAALHGQAPSYHEVVELKEFEPEPGHRHDRVGRPLRALQSRSAAYEGWKRSVFPVDWFDSRTGADRCERGRRRRRGRLLGPAPHRRAADPVELRRPAATTPTSSSSRPTEPTGSSR